MNTQLEAIQELIRINRDAMRELAKVAETTSADYVHIDNAMRMLGEQFLEFHISVFLFNMRVNGLSMITTT